MTRSLAHRLIQGISASLAIGLALSAAACGASNENNGNTSSSTPGAVKVRVAYLNTANYLTTLNDEQFAQHQLAPNTVQFSGPFTPPDALVAVQAGKADMTTTGTGYFIKLLEQRSPFVAFALEHYSGNSQGIVAAPGTGIMTLKDLYGKRVAIDRKGATGDYVLHQAFAHAKLDLSRVHVVEMKATDFATAFRSGAIDAVSSFDQNLATAQAVPGAHTVITGDQYGSTNVTIHLVSRAFAKAHPEQVKAMYRALVEESNKAQHDPQLISRAYRHIGAPESIIKQLATYTVPDIEPIDARGLASLQEQAKQYLDFGFIKSIPDVASSVMNCAE